MIQKQKPNEDISPIKRSTHIGFGEKYKLEEDNDFRPVDQKNVSLEGSKKTMSIIDQ